MVRASSPPSTAQRWYPAIAAVERDATCAEMERLARGQPPSKAWQPGAVVTTTSAQKTVKRSASSGEGVEQLLRATKNLDGLDRLTTLAHLLEGSETEAAIPVDARGFNGQTTMAFSAAAGLDDVMQLLLRYDADVNLANSRGWTPLMLACQRNSASAVSVLLSTQAQTNLGQTNRDGESALTIALAAGHVEICTALVRAGAVLPTMLGPGSAFEARKEMVNLARRGLHLSASSGATAVVRECLRVVESRDWDRQNPPASAVSNPRATAETTGADEAETMLFAKTGQRVEKFLWPGHRLAKGMEKRRAELRARGEEMLREAAGRQRRLPRGTIVLLAPDHESAGNGALRGDETGTVVKVTSDDARCRVKGPSGRHCWYAVEELLSWQEKKVLDAAVAANDSSDLEMHPVDPRLPQHLCGDRGSDSSRPVWGASEIIRRNQSATVGFQVAEEERRYTQEMRRQEAARHQKELWEKQRQRRMHKKGSHAQKLLQEAFARGDGKTPEGTELDDIVASCRINEAEVVEWFSYARKQQKERKAGLRWGNAGGALVGQGSDDDLLRRVDEAERELRLKKLEKIKRQEEREAVRAKWVSKWGGEVPTARERKRMGGEDDEPPLEDPYDDQDEENAAAAQRAWAEKTAAEQTTGAWALLARRKRQQEIDDVSSQVQKGQNVGPNLSRSMLSRRNAVTAADLGGSRGDSGNGASSLDNLTKCLRVARSYEPSKFGEVLEAQLGESNGKTTRKMMRTAERSRIKQEARQGKTRWQCAHYGFPADPCDWSVEIVCKWLRRLGLGSANHKIRGRHIDGPQLTYMHVDTFCTLIGSADRAGDADQSIDGVFDKSGSDGTLEKAAARAIQFLQSGFSEDRWHKRIAAELQLDKEDFYSPFHLSIIQQDQVKLERYIERGQDVNARTALGRSPLMLAVGTGNIKIVDMLREAGSHDPQIPYSPITRIGTSSRPKICKQQRHGGSDSSIDGSDGGGWTDRSSSSSSSSVASSQTISDEAPCEA